ncbi:MAG: radical protein [Sediminibacterium sp.]|nr:radical protein [Sediminibacterium sp.]
MRSISTIAVPGKSLMQVYISNPSKKQSSGNLSNAEKKIVWWAIKLRLFYLTCITIKHPKRIMKLFAVMLKLRKNIWGGDLEKIHRIGNRYYYNIYTPGWPSKAYDDLIKSELRRHASPLTISEKLSFIFFAVTRKCPLRCEHCFEWDNLNQKESFTKEELLKTVELFQKEGVLQIHFSGGEPMVRIKDLLEVIKLASNKSECWVVTSGFNLTKENAGLLKKAGCKGVVVSIDHYIPELHNLFRNHPDSFNKAVEGVKAARNAGLVTAVSVCATKHFISSGHTMPYIEFAKTLGVNFVQVLEPKNVGNYSGKDVLLEEQHIVQLEKIFTNVNHSPVYKDYPTLMYHGYHQRRVGCFSGSRSVYVDSVGDVHACPFCHTSAYNILDIIRGEHATLPLKENACPRYEKIA